MTIAEQVLSFYASFVPPSGIAKEIVLHNPFNDPARRSAIEVFHEKFFSDDHARVHILGINPSRLSSTSTGVNYTDGFALETYCGIDNAFSKNRELTADFFYRVVEASGGAGQFFGRVFPWAMMPVSLTKKGNYANYYGNDILHELNDLVIENVKWTSKLPSTGRVVLLGSGENQKVFKNLPGSPFGYNDVRVLPHPRWIMQYNRDRLDEFVAEYVEALS